MSTMTNRVAIYRNEVESKETGLPHPGVEPLAGRPRHSLTRRWLSGHPSYRAKMWRYQVPGAYGYSNRCWSEMMTFAYFCRCQPDNCFHNQ